MKTLHAVSLSLALLTSVLLCSCADFWFDWRNGDNPPPDTPAVDIPPEDPAPSVVRLTDDQLVSSATQSLILALTRKGLTGTGMYCPQNLPPCRAREMARGAVVTVSMAALIIGMFSLILGASWVLTSVWAGKTEDSAGTRRTSSNVKASGKSFIVYLFCV